MGGKTSQYNLRIDRTLLDKIAYVAGAEERSINGEILVLIKKRVAEFERDLGPIPIEKEDEDTEVCEKCKKIND